MFQVGKWQSRSTLIIHAVQAESLLKGQRAKLGAQAKKHRIWGLKAFSLLVAHIYQRAKAGDPYAELNLIEVERRLDNAFQLTYRHHIQLDQYLERHLPGIAVSLYESEKPLLVPLNFPTPYGNLGARLIGEYDLIVRKVETCMQLGLLNSQQRNRFLKSTRRIIRGVFSAPVQYRDMGITQNDLLHQTDKGKSAIDSLGAVSEEILHGKIRAKYGPRQSLK